MLSQAGDPYEVEADRVAEAVVSPGHDAGPRGYACGGEGSRPGCDESKPGPLLRKATGDVATSGNSVVHPALGSGRPLEPPVRDFMESRFSHDFGSVRVHTGPGPAAAAQSLDALAFTAGPDVVFAEGRYQPETADGRKLLAHELAHVVQQGEGAAAGPMPAVRRTIDAAHSTLTPAAVKPLTDQEIVEQLRLVRAQLATLAPTSLEYSTLQMNERLLQEEQVLRGVQQSAPAPGTEESDLDAQVARFKQAVLQTAVVRLTLNQQNLERWRAYLNSKLTPLQVQQESLGTTAADLEKTAAQTHASSTFNEWAGDPSARRRWVLEQQIQGRYRACTGCHLIVRADELDKIDPMGGDAALTPAQRLGAMAGIGAASVPQSPAQRAERRLSGMNAAIVHRAVLALRPTFEPLGPNGYKVIPEDTLSTFANASAKELLAAIDARIAQRESDCEELKARIRSGDVEYLDLAPILQDLLATAAPEVRDEIRDEIEAAGVRSIVVGVGVLAATLLSIVFPPLALAVAAFQIYQGYEQFQKGENYLLGTGANDVFTPEQQESAGGMMAGGIVNMGMGAVALGTSVAPVTDWAATSVLIKSDISIANGLATRSLSGPIPEVELLALRERGLFGRAAEGWLDLRGQTLLYRGQGALTEEILSPLAREKGLGASQNLYDTLKAQGLTDEQIAGYTAKWNYEPVPPFDTPPGMAPNQPLGGAGIPTSRLPSVSSRFAQGPTGVIYVLRVPKSFAIEVGPAGWGRMSVVEAENVIFHQVPNGYIIRTLDPALFPPLQADSPPGMGWSLIPFKEPP